MALYRTMLVFALLVSLGSIVRAAVHERSRLPFGWREADAQVSAETVVSLQVALYSSPRRKTRCKLFVDRIQAVSQYPEARYHPTGRIRPGQCGLRRVFHQR